VFDGGGKLGDVADAPTYLGQVSGDPTVRGKVTLTLKDVDAELIIDGIDISRVGCIHVGGYDTSVRLVETCAIIEGAATSNVVARWLRSRTI
jgi:hypothetical protein